IGAWVKDMTNEALYVSVQAVDGAGARSGWSDPALIQAGGALDRYDTNRDGSVNSADPVTWQLLNSGRTAPAGSNGGVSGDGKIDGLDGDFLLARLLGKAGPGRDVAAVQTIGPEGGAIVLEDFELEIAAG